MIYILLVIIFLVQHDPRECRIDPAWPLVELLMNALALIEQEISVDLHHTFTVWVAKLECKDSHLKELTLRLLPWGLEAPPLREI